MTPALFCWFLLVSLLSAWGGYDLHSHLHIKRLKHRAAQLRQAAARLTKLHPDNPEIPPPSPADRALAGGYMLAAQTLEEMVK